MSEDKTIKITGENIQISDGYHTFDELYEHRVALFLALCALLPASTRGWKQSEYEYGEWVIAFAYIPTGVEHTEQISYHIPRSKIPSWLDQRDDYIWDGHTSTDVVNRLEKFCA